MPASLTEARKLKELLEDRYADRHHACRRLRQLYHGHFWDEADRKGGIVSIFRDLMSPQQTVGPNLKVVRNLLHQIALKYQTLIAPLPMVRVPVEPPMSEQRRAKANFKERVIYGLWGEGNMGSVHRDQLAWYLPLMGDCFLGVYPDFKRDLVVPVVRSPEHAYPVPSAERPGMLDAVIFSRAVDERFAQRMYPNYKPRPTMIPMAPRVSLTGRPPQDSSSQVEILEWSDTDCYRVWVDDQLVVKADHELGFNLFDQVQFVHLPGEPFGMGAVEQIVSMNELSNATLALVWQAMLENVFPTLILVDPQKAPETLMRGAGSVIPLNAGGAAEFLQPPAQTVAAQLGFVGAIEQQMKEQAGVSDPMFGQFKASIVTGKAINELQGAGTGTTIEMVQSSLGGAMVSWNSKALYMLKELFADERIRLTGMIPRHYFDIAPQTTSMSFYGREITGGFRNEVIYSPSLDQHTKLVMVLQALGGGLISRKHGREQIGIPDSEAMDEEILQERIQDGTLEAIMAMIQSPEQAADVQEQGVRFIEGTALPDLPTVAPEQMTALPPGSNGAPPGATMPPGGAPPDLAALMGAGGGQVPPELASMMGAAPAPEAAGGMLSLDQVAGMIQSVEGIEGRVFLVGAIVANGAADVVEIALTARDDRATIMETLPELAGRARFSIVSGEPDEPWFEVTPGTAPAFGGAEPSMDELAVFGG
jgi:hypothetical protein